jgi:NADH-quinone oxidoreductase subunit N
MTLGNVCALRQSNVRRLMAYSSIANAGYLMIGLSAALAGSGQAEQQYGLAASFIHLAAYAIASLGTFAVLAGLSDEREELSTVESLAGLSKARPLYAAVLAICMFSLAGIPPLAGFWGKLTLFGSALRAASVAAHANARYWFALLALVGALNAAIAAAYYLRIVAIMYFRPATARRYPQGGFASAVAIVVCAGLVVAIGLAPRIAVDAARVSAEGLRSPEMRYVTYSAVAE